MKDRQVWDALVLVMQFGVNMIVPILLCVALGVWIGDKTGANWIVIPLFFMGALAGFTNIFRMSKKVYDRKRKRNINNVKKGE